MLAAALKLVIPIIIVFPGIMATRLYADRIELADQAYPVMIREVLPAGSTSRIMTG
jgi:SSS family solute:Na+ symporter